MRLKQKIIHSIVAGILLAPLFSQYTLAATGLIYITPGSSSIQLNNSETLSLRINPGTTVDGVQATVTYNAADLRLNSVDTSSSPFSTQLQKSVSSGSITLALGNLSGGVSTDALIANMNFTALVSNGSTTLNISNANATSSGSYTNPSTANAAVGFTAPPAPQPSPAPSPTAPVRTKTTTTITDSTKSMASSGGSVTAAPLSPAHLTSTLASTSYTSATLHIVSDRSLNLYAIYGTDAAHLSLKTSVVTNSTADVELGSQTPLTPGTTYYYEVIGEDPSGTQTKLPVKHFTTKGFTISVTVLDTSNKPLAHHTVELHSQVQTTTTDAKGVATFTDVAPGEHHLIYKANGGKEYSAVVYVADTLPSNNTKSATATPRTAAVIFPVSLPHNNVATRVILTTCIILVCILVASIIGYILITASGRKFWTKHSAIATLHLL